MLKGLKIVGGTLALLFSMYLYADNAPSVKPGYQSTIETGGVVEQQYLEDGAYQTARYTARAESPIEKYTVYYPKELENGTQTYPMVLIVNGTGGKATKYEPLLKHLASWGFVVVGTQDKGTGTGETTIQTLNYMLSLNDDPDSRFFQKNRYGKHRCYRTFAGRSRNLSGNHDVPGKQVVQNSGSDITCL